MGWDKSVLAISKHWVWSDLCFLLASVCSISDLLHIASSGDILTQSNPSLNGMILIIIVIIYYKKSSCLGIDPMREY
jgi:hypothetical protein